MPVQLLSSRKALAAHASGSVARAQKLEAVLGHLDNLGPQCTWLGSRTLGRSTRVYRWVSAASRILAENNVVQKTGGYAGLMEAPHFGCHLAKRLDRVAALGVDFIGDEDFNPHVTDAGFSVRFSDLNSRHDALFFGSDVIMILPGRLGTVHEKFDLLNRMKLGLLSGVEVFLIELNGYYSLQMEFQTSSTGIDLGPRISPADYGLVKIIDMATTTPEDFADRVLKIMSPR